MTLEEAIKHCEENVCDNSLCSMEHKQLEEWLKELQSLRSNKNKIISPYFENGVFTGVRVTLGDEDFVIAAKDFRNGKAIPWKVAMDDLKAEGLATWNYHQICLTMAYRKEVDKVLSDNGGDSLDNWYLTFAENSERSAFSYYGFNGSLEIISKREACSIRAIKNLKK